MTRSTHHPHYRVFLDLLRDARKAAGVTQVVLAERLGNRQVFVSKLENGDRRMDVVDLLEYCRAAGIDFCRFVRELKVAVDQLPRPRDRKLAVRTRRPPRK